MPEPRLRELLYANARNDGRAAFQQLVVNCRQEIDDLEMQQLNADFDAATILMDWNVTRTITIPRRAQLLQC